LFLSAVLLWRLERKGLTLLLCTFGAEFLYSVGVVVGAMYLDSKAGGGRRPLGETLGIGASLANMELFIQMFTGYPVVAGVLISLAYRYLGIPAREPES
jgi:hypothetical protein